MGHLNLSHMKLRLLSLTLLSSLLLPLALPNEIFPSGNIFIGIICLIPYYFALRYSPRSRFSALMGMVFGALSTLLANYWLMFFGEFSLWTLGGVILGYIGYNALFAPYLSRFLRERNWYRPFLFAAAWTAYEYFKSIGYLGYPWGLSAYPTASVLPLIQVVDIAGIWPLSFFVCLCNGLLAESMSFRMQERQTQSGKKGHSLIYSWLFLFILLFSSLVYGYIKLSRPLPYQDKLSLLLVQQNSDSWLRGNAEKTLLTAERLTEEGLAKAAEKPDIIVWSETSLPWPPLIEGKDYYRGFPRDRPFIPFVRSLNSYFLTGGIALIDSDPALAMNSVLFLSPDAEVLDFYGKQHPVPFAENVPFWELDWVRNFFSEVIGLRAVWTMGNRYTIFDLPRDGKKDIRFGTPICFEDAFAYLNRTLIKNGADLLINLTNNSWSKTDSAQIQHFVASRFRAVENRCVLVRSTNSGLTCIVDPWGRIIAELPMFTEGSLFAEFPVYRPGKFTAYTLYGDYLPIAFLILLFAVLLFPFMKAKFETMRNRIHQKT
jgi:apolipoprotein N-acyltransferase